jgi:hypothetical protein
MRKTRFRFQHYKSTANDSDGENVCSQGLWHRRLVLLAERHRPSHRRSTDLAKSPPHGIVNPVTFCIDLFRFSSFRFGSRFLFFYHLGHVCTSSRSSYPLDDENSQKDSDPADVSSPRFHTNSLSNKEESERNSLQRGSPQSYFFECALVSVPLISQVGFRLSWAHESSKDAGFWSQ